jgi:esterase/lipase superfamily enzyme
VKKLRDLHGEHRDHVHWFSMALRRRMDVLRYGRAGRRVLWFPSFGGRFHDAEHFGLIAAIDDLIETGALQVVCVDSVDAESFGDLHRPPQERLRRHDAFDRYLTKELVPWFHDVTGSDEPITVFGTSFGAFHAVNFAFRHPQLVDKVVGFSGKYHLGELLGPYWDETAYFHSPVAYVANMDGNWVARLSALDINLVSGENDYCLDGTRALLDVLEAKGIPYRGDIWDAPYGHEWADWQHQLTHYLP